MDLIEMNEASKRNAKNGKMGAASGVEPMTDKEAIEMREEYGYILKTRGKRGSKSSGVHIPKEKGSLRPKCDKIGQVGKGVEFSDKSNSVFSHGYVKESAYSYCDHCVRLWREDG